jgi:hypothetical protein
MAGQIMHPSNGVLTALQSKEFYLFHFIRSGDSLLLFHFQPFEPLGAQTLLSTSAFTCPRGNASLALIENRLQFPSQPLRHTRKLGTTGFCQIWIPNYSFLAKPLSETTKRGEWEPLIWERKQRKRNKKGHSQTPLLWACQMWRSLSSYMYMSNWGQL